MTAAAARIASRLDRLAGVIAILGGMLALALAGLVVASVLGRWLFGRPVPGDFEIVQMGTAVAIFAFLPHCQARRGNIFVDSFTSRLGERARRRIDALWDVVYAATMAVIAYCLFTGTLSAYRNGETTMMAQLAIWPAFALCATLAGFLTLVTLAGAWRRLRGEA